MRRNIIPIGDVIAVNQIADDGTSADEASRQAVGEFFSARGHAVEFAAGGSDFWAVRP